MPELRAGDFTGSYQLVSPAPLDFIRGNRTRDINGRYVKGSWSEPWWAYSPDHGWAVVRRWKNKALAADRWSAAVPAQDTTVTEPWTTTASADENGLESL